MVDGSGIRKGLDQVRLEEDDIRARAIGFVVYATHTLGEIVLRPHVVVSFSGLWIHGEENTRLGQAHPRYVGVAGATEVLVVNGVALPFHAADDRHRLIGHSHIELRPHTSLRE